MNDDIAIKVEHVSKTFKLPHERMSSVKSALINVARRKKGYEVQKVLNDISLEIKKGEFFGIVGRNGSGKSTLLKMLAGIYMPSHGTIQVNGKLTPFIELGVGFNPELTGRENVFLNGSLLGFSRSQMSSMYDDIVRFAELDRFMDQKLKNYSSGMQVRLAFSIAIRVNTDILVLDEVLAVGDEAFQRKCFSYFEELKRTKRTVVLVTHDMASVERYCSRAILIEDGVIKKEGDPFGVAAAYSRSNDESYVASQQAVAEASQKEEKTKEVVAEGSNEAELIQPPSDIKIELLNDKRVPARSFGHGDTMIVKLSWTKPKVQAAGVAILRKSGEYIFGPNTYQDKFTLKNQHELLYEVVLNLGSGDYFIKAGIFGKNDKDVIDFEEMGPEFYVKRNYKQSRWGGLTRLTYRWLP